MKRSKAPIEPSAAAGSAPGCARARSQPWQRSRGRAGDLGDHRAVDHELPERLGVDEHRNGLQQGGSRLVQRPLTRHGLCERLWNDDGSPIQSPGLHFVVCFHRFVQAVSVNLGAYVP